MPLPGDRWSMYDLVVEDKHSDVYIINTAKPSIRAPEVEHSHDLPNDAGRSQQPLTMVMPSTKDSLLFQVPSDIRKLIYDQLIVLERDLDAGHAGTDPATQGLSELALRMRAADLRRNILFSNREMHREFKAGWYGTMPWEFLVCDILAGPVPGLIDNAGERCIIAEAASYRGFKGVGRGMPIKKPIMLYVQITILQDRVPAYRLQWTHMSEQQMDWAQMGDAQYNAMVQQVETEVAGMVAERRAADGIDGLTWDGLHRVIGAFFLHHLPADPTHDDENEDDGLIAWEGPDETFNPLFDW
ncbi:hypothetical protein LTR53_013945 [Teratosphaeriaceae sp. CCFEE 6253]|nr:hypothetical protein LTR53_013945 [Teratosphaeriaceae sp. CCFEE 6253]